MAKMIRLSIAAGMDQIAGLIEALTALGLAATLQTDDGETEAVVGKIADVPARRINSTPQATGARKAGRKLARRAGGRRSVYVAVSGHKKEAGELSENRATVYASIVKHPNEGMADHQSRLSGKVEPKTVDGSIFYLRTAGLVKSIDAK